MKDFTGTRDEKLRAFLGGIVVGTKKQDFEQEAKDREKQATKKNRLSDMKTT